MNDTVAILNLPLGTHEKRVSALIASLAITLLSPCLLAAAVPDATQEHIFEQVSPSVVSVGRADAHGNFTAQGSGIVIARGHVITTCHVVGKGKKGQVTHSGKRYEATLQSSEPDLDLCRLNVPQLNAPPVTLSTALSVKTGQRIYAVGIAEDQSPPAPSLSKGVISSLRPYLRSQYIRISAAIPPGFSGGGLFDARGALIGIISHPAGAADDFTFALPVDWIGELPIQDQPAPTITKKDELGWLNRALALERSADWRGLLKLSQREVKHHPGNAAAWFSLGMAFANLKQYEPAVAAYREAIRNQAEYGDAWHQLGVAYAHLKDYDNAVEAFRDAVRMQPENAAAWYDLGNAYYGHKQYAHAIYAYREALQIEPENAAVWYNLGMTYDDLKLYVEAAEAYTETVRIQPENAEAWYKLGVDYALLDERGRLRDVYRALRSLDSERAEQYFNTYILP
jgi:cytochrome c-type biogenesis protein CcmH/NrfG